MGTEVLWNLCGISRPKKHAAWCHRTAFQIENAAKVPDTSILPELALILDTSVDEILGGGSSGWIYRRRITVERMQEAIRCIKQLKELLGPDHFIYRIMADALNERMNSSVEEAFVNDIALDAYVCEAIIECIKNGDHIDTDDIRRNIKADGPKQYTLKVLEEMGIR